MAFGSKRINTTVAPAKTVSLVKGSGPAIPRVNLEKANASLSLVKTYDKVGMKLSMYDLTGLQAQVIVVLDHSLSMSSDYASGDVQKIVERALGFGLQVDKDGTVPVIPFDRKLHKTVEVKLENYQNIVNDKIWKQHDMGTTDLTKALDEVLDMVKRSDDPIFLIIVTDGNPDNPSSALRRFIELANYPVFIKCLAIREVAFLRNVDDLEDSNPGARLLDNVDSQYFDGRSGEGHHPTIDMVKDGEFADAMLNELPEWIVAAKSAGLLR